MPLPEPFGKYELLEQIGAGGMAEVFLARTVGLAGFERRLVIKRIRPEHASDPRFVSLFIHEARIAVHLHHPNIVTAYELGKVRDSYYLAMEYLHGRDLNKLARVWRGADPGLDPAQAVGIVAEVCRGLAYAHGSSDPSTAGVSLVHRDVSPHNVFLTFAGEVKLVDFGIARLLNGDQPRIAPTGPARPAGGKYAYMSPEQAAGRPVDHRTDLFSAGVVLWELLAGRKLHPGADPEAKLERVKRPEIGPPTPDVDPDLWAILQRALAVAPDDRYPSAAILEEDLRAWLYDHHARADKTTLAELMARSFPDARHEDRAALDLGRLAEDLGRLDTHDELSTYGSADTPSAPRPAAPPTRPTRLAPATDERKRVATLVVDVDGFTALSSRAEPEVLFKRHLQLLRWLRGVVDAHGGNVQHVHDDQITVFFGVPRTRRDDLHRALDCALDLQRRIGELQATGVPVHLSIGVHTGDVTVGSDNTRRYMARGNTTRLARRLSEQGDHGHVLVSEDVYRAVDADYDWSRGPWLLGRGGRPPLPSYRLLARSTHALPTPRGKWLRRGHELDVLRDALGDVAGGQGATVVLTGKEGSGKTRLVREFCAIADRRHLPIHLGSAGPFGYRLRLLREVVGGLLDLDPQATPAEVSAQVERLRPLGLYTRDLDVLTALLGGGERTVDDAEIWSTVTRTLLALAEEYPIVVVFEDVHHLEPRQLAFFSRALERLRAGPILVLATWSAPEPPELPAARLVHLPPFQEVQQERLIAGLLGTDTVSHELLELVVSTCEGNPLYIEELVRYLHAEALVTTDGGVAALSGDGPPSVPDTLAGLIAARIDDLDPASKGALQLAAVIGQDFGLRLLAEVIGIDDPFPLVADLAARGLIRPTDQGDRWAFASAFVQQAALRGILGVQRRDHHRLIAAAIERQTNADRPDWLEQLAAHCGRGGRSLDAARYAYQAGAAYEEEQEFARARAAYHAGLRWLADAEPTPETWDARTQGEAMLRLKLGAVSLLLGEIAPGQRELGLALDITSDANLPWLEARAHLELARHHLQAGTARVAGAHLEQARAIARMEEEVELEIEVLEATAEVAHAEGRLEASLASWRQALELGRHDPRCQARVLNGIANCHLRSGDLDAARPALEEALDAARRAEDRLLEGRILNNIGLLYAWQGHPDDAIAQFRRALRIRAALGYSRGAAVNHHNIGDVHFSAGELARAYVAFQRSRDIAEEMGWDRGVAMNDVYLGFIDAVEHGDDAGLERVRAAAEDARAFGDHEIALTGDWLLARLLVRRGLAAEARARLTHALTHARRLELHALGQLLEATLDELGGQGDVSAPAPRG